MHTDRDPVVTMRAITKRFPGVTALDSVDLALHPGQIHALTGENGSGKSTAAKILGGSYQPDTGVVSVDGHAVNFTSESDALRHGIVTISQELTLAPTLTVAENIFLGRLPTGRFGRVSWNSMNSAARQHLDRFGVDVDETAVVGNLRIELQQEVEIARALSTPSRVLILDEATSSLSESAAERLLSVVEHLRDRGVAVLMISHRMPEIYRLATEATVLRDGRVVSTLALPDTKESDLVRSMVGREPGDHYGSRAPEHHIGASNRPALRLRGFATTDGAVLPLDLDVHRGEIVGVAGLNGSGKHGLGLGLAGATPTAGTVEVNGAGVSVHSPAAARDGGIGYVPADRKGAGLLLDRSVTENFSLAQLRRFTPFGILRGTAERSAVAQAIKRYSVRTASAATTVRVLSCGNQQKIILGRTFDLECPVYVLDEPTRGVDVGSKSTIYSLLRAEAARGAAVILISSELPELLGLSDRVVAMHRGSIVGEFSGPTMTEELVNHATVSGRMQTTPISTIEV
ncbi:sugar ABC transporter ATP-binding protein [Rhodococcus erythropolis]|uniref:sugar ABC transporter ATP-binding protein n=1 Tax=Rhodococcus erythropolis TaxID=1833 RepID=UPI001BEB73F7|nr:sugar ABC transporter ATP-binding protein [Rhodococcus erythropolis]MBT2268972.1 sugar ABC transporter ATP-binding protein [Rhodococcus erythropolis]